MADANDGNGEDFDMDDFDEDDMPMDQNNNFFAGNLFDLNGPLATGPPLLSNYELGLNLLEEEIPPNNLARRHPRVTSLLRTQRNAYLADPYLQTIQRPPDPLAPHQPHTHDNIPRRNDAYAVHHPISPEDVDLFMQGYIDSFDNNNRRRIQLSLNYLPATDATKILEDPHPREAWEREITENRPQLIHHRRYVYAVDNDAVQMVKTPVGWFLVTTKVDINTPSSVVVFDKGQHNTDAIMNFAHAVHPGRHVYIDRHRDDLPGLASPNAHTMSLLEQTMRMINHGDRMRGSAFSDMHPHLVSEYHIPIMNQVQHLNRINRPNIRALTNNAQIKGKMKASDTQRIANTLRSERFNYIHDPNPIPFTIDTNPPEQANVRQGMEEIEEDFQPMEESARSKIPPITISDLINEDEEDEDAFDIPSSDDEEPPRPTNGRKRSHPH